MQTRPASWFATCFVVALLAFPTAADIVLDWNVAALDAIRANRTPPPRASRALAITHAAIFDAVNGIRRNYDQCFAANGSFSAKQAPTTASIEAAASAAASHSLRVLFPSEANRFDTLHASILATIPDGTRKTSGVTWGDRCAKNILTARAADGADVAVPIPPSPNPGDWLSTPPAFAPYLLPQWAFLMPFAMNSPTQFRPPPPPSLDSEDWAFDYQYTLELGSTGSTFRTDDQTQIALFWADGAGTETPPGHWNHIASDLAHAQNLSLEENARLFALLNLALADAAICAWDAKYGDNWWRPVTAIRAGDTDGNDLTLPVANWAPLIVTPPFPEHTSGHSTFSGAGAVVLARFFGTDEIAFSSGSDFLPGIVRHFDSFSEAAIEAGMSRIYGGIHFMSANIGGLEAGAEIGHWVVDHTLLPRRFPFR